ncbi:MAG: transglutaminase domain-containing protein [Firmicutes bacterium]|nr:transglutaminase domain-containing protein [Bacillota bacterium]
MMMNKKNTLSGISLKRVPARQQNNGKSDILLGVFAALTVISLGGMFLSLSDFDVYGSILILGALLSVGGCFAFARYPACRKILIAVGLILFLVLFFLGGKNGFAVVFNAVKDLYGTALGRVFLPYALPAACNETLAATMFLWMVTMVLSVVVTYMTLLRSKAVYCLVLLFLPFLLIPAVTSPNPVWFLLLVFSLTLSLCAGIGNLSEHRVCSVLLLSAALVGAVLSMIGLFFIGSDFEKSDFFANREISVTESVSELRYGRDRTNNFPEGDFSRYDSFVYTEDIALEITMTNPQSLYLRGYVGSVFTEDGWRPVDRTELYSYADLFYTLHQNGFYGTSQLAMASSAVGTEEEIGTVTVKNVNAKKEYIYTPYELVDADVGKAMYRIGDIAPKESDYEDPAEVTYSVLPNRVRNIGTLAEDLGKAAESGDEDVIAYLSNEAAYRAFVYDVCLDLPEGTEDVLKSHFDAPDLSEGHEDYGDVIQKIYDHLLVNTEYNEECGTIPQDSDFLRYFLENSGEGYSLHYATAAALIFRYYGIPARYVEGYIVTPDDVAAAEGNTVFVDGGNAHAWVEYYRDGVGWIPLETTPPYLFIMEQPEEIQSLVSDTLNNSSAQSGMVEMEEDNYEEIEEEESERPEDSSISPWLIVALVGCGMILLLGIAVIVLILRRRKTLAKREQQIREADPRVAVDLLFRHSLEMIFAAGIREQNGSLDQYIIPLREEDAALALRYESLCDLHREARFSDHSVSVERKETFELFRKESETFLRSRSKLRKRFIDQYIHHLY